MELLHQIDLTDLLRRALVEDLGQGDVTTAATVNSGQRGRAKITVKEPRMILCGGPILVQVFALAGAGPNLTFLAPESVELNAGDRIAQIDGTLAGMLIGERVALNFVQLLSGIATLTRKYVDVVAGTGAKIIDTRKTHPGLRAIEKYAVRAGGGFNHRFGLDSGILIKDNHIAAAGSVKEAIERTRRLAPHSLRVEVECETLAQVSEALEARADAILLDNMALGDLRRAREMARETGHGKVMLEASGGVTLETVRAIAETGVDVISIGALTHSAPAVDISMRIEAV